MDIKKFISDLIIGPVSININVEKEDNNKKINITIEKDNIKKIDSK